MSRKKILLACFEVPGWGGASTSAYKLFQMLQADGLQIVLVNIIGEDDVAYFQHLFGEDIGNPRGLKGVFNCFLQGNNYRHQVNLHNLIESIDPDLVIGIGLTAVYILKMADPRRKLIYLTTGCGWMKGYLKWHPKGDFLSFAQRLLNHPERIAGGNEMERKAVQMADLVVTHSDITLQLHKAIYPSSAAKLYSKVVWFSEWIYEDALEYAQRRKDFVDRQNDVLFIANDWGRPEKNYRLVKKIIARLKDLAVHIVGEVREKLPGVTYHNFVGNRAALFTLMSDSKVVASASSFDASPGILFEGSAMGCNVITSKNCGNWQLCNMRLLVEPVSVAGFVDCIHRATSLKFEDNIDMFHEKKSYDDFKDLLKNY